jgi:hypothetical protein
MRSRSAERRFFCFGKAWPPIRSLRPPYCAHAPGRAHNMS